MVVEKLFQAEPIFANYYIGSVMVKLTQDLCVVVNSFYLIIAVYKLV